MNKILTRFLVLILCICLIFETQSMNVFASSLNGTEVGDKSGETITDEKDESQDDETEQGEESIDEEPDGEEGDKSDDTITDEKDESQDDETEKGEESTDEEPDGEEGDESDDTITDENDESQDDETTQEEIEEEEKLEESTVEEPDGEEGNESIGDTIDEKNGLQDAEIVKEAEEHGTYDAALAGTITEEEWSENFYGGTGSEDDPYIISSAEQLDYFNKHYNEFTYACERYYRLLNSIDYSGYEWIQLQGYDGVKFDGAGYTIRNVKIVASNELGTYMFPRVISLTNLTIENVTFVDNIGDPNSAHRYYAVLAGFTESEDVILNCHVTGDIQFELPDSMGEILYASIAYYNVGTIENCDFSGRISVDGDLGGIVWRNDGGTVKNCTNNGTICGIGGIEGDGNDVAGIANRIYEGTISCCYNKGTVSTVDGNASGIADLVTRGGEIDASHNNGEVRAKEDAAGIARMVSGDSCISMCSNNGQLYGKSISAIASILDGGSIIECVNYSNFETDATEVSGLINEVRGDTDYAVLVSKCKNLGNITAKNGSVGGIVGGINEGYFSQNAKVTIDECVNAGTIISMPVNGNAAGIVRGIGCSNSAEFNVFINKCSNTGHIEATWASGIVGSISGKAEVKITECYCDEDSSIKGSSSAAGIVGSQEDTCVVSGCYNLGEIYSDGTAAGIVGSGCASMRKGSGRIECCYNAGEVNGKSQSAGIIGSCSNYKYDITISDCYNSGHIMGRDGCYPGGIIGEASAYDGYEFNIVNCYNIGPVTKSEYGGNDKDAGQLFGDVLGSSEIYSIVNCYYSTDMGTATRATSSNAGWMNDAGSGVYGVSTSDMQKQSCYSGWDFENIWSIEEGEYPYPTLACIGAGDAFRINYVLNGGKNNQGNVKRYYQDDKVTLYPPTREGYRFKGWYTESSFENPISEINGEIRKNITVYAKWEKGDEVLEAVKINGSGYAFFYATLYDDSGKVLKNEPIKYELYDITMSEENLVSSDITSSDDNGKYRITSPRLENSYKNVILTRKYRIDIYVNNDGVDKKLGYATYVDVDVEPFTYNQKWDIGCDLSARIGTNSVDKIELPGDASLEVSLAGIGANGSIGRHITVAQEVSGNKKSVEMSESYISKIGGDFSFGPDITIKEKDKTVFSLPSWHVKSGISYGTTISPGLKIDDYDANDEKDWERLGAYLLTSTALSTGDVMLLGMANVATKDVDYVSVLSDKTTLMINAGADVGKKLDDFYGVGVSGALDTTAVYTFAQSDRLDYRESSKTTAFMTDTKASVFKAGKKFTISGDVGLQASGAVEFSGGDATSITAANFNNSGTDVLTYSISNTDKDSFIIGSSKTENSQTISYEGEEAAKICRDVDDFGKFAYGDARFLLDSEQNLMIAQLNTSEAVGKYQQTKSKEAGLSIPIGFAVPNYSVVSTFSGSYQAGYVSEQGSYTKGVATADSQCDGALMPETKSDDIVDLLNDPFVGMYKKVLNTVGDTYKKVENGVVNFIENSKAKVKVTAEKINDGYSYLVHIFTPDRGNNSNLRSLSYDVPLVMAYRDDIVQTDPIATIHTVGEPYMIYVTECDANGEDTGKTLAELPDGDEFELTLEYDADSLSNAGINDINGGNIAIYKYSDELEGYECVGGTRDYDNQSVSVMISEPGQYILGIDENAPLVKNIDISDHSATPTFIISFDENSGFKEFSLKIDGDECVGTAGWKALYKPQIDELAYTVVDPLEEGEHALTIMATDTAGNTMTKPVEYIFVVDTCPPKITEANVVIDENMIRVKAKTNDKDIASITAEIIETNQNNETKKHIVTLDSLDAEDYYTAVFNRAWKNSAVYIEKMIASDYCDNRAESGPYGEDKNMMSSDAINDLWYAEADGLKYDYSGAAIKPSLKVYEEGKLLKEKKDYKITYQNNKNAYEHKEGDKDFDASKAPKIIITGAGNYNQKEEIFFVIKKKSIEDENVSVADIASVQANGKVKKPVPVVKWGKKKLVNNKDFTVQYFDSKGESEVVCKEAGDYIIRVTGKGNYTGQIEKNYTIFATDRTLISKATLDKIKDVPYDDGNEVAPQIVLTNKTTKDSLKLGQDYKVEYEPDLVNVGKVKVIITGIGKYCGTRISYFNILGRKITKAKIAGLPRAVDYTGSAITPEITLTYSTGRGTTAVTDILTSADYEIEYKNNTYPGTATVIIKGKGRYTGEIKKQFTINGIAFKPTVTNLNSAVYTGEEIEADAILTIGEKELTQGEDYKVEYRNNVKAGKVTVVYTGCGIYKGTVKKTFKIIPREITDPDIDVTYEKSVPYVMGGAKPEVTVTYKGEELVLNKDYTVKYSNNSTVTTATTTKKPLLTITGKGNFKLTLRKEYLITTQSIDAEGITMTAPDKVANSKAGSWKSVPVITDRNGKKLVAGKDYSKAYKYYNVTEAEELSGREMLQPGTVVRVTASGIGKYSEEISTTYRVVLNDISKLKATVDVKAYTGKAITLEKSEIKLKQGNKDITEDIFEIVETSYMNNIKKGKATVVIKGKGNYGGTKKITYTIGSKGFLWWWRNLLQ